MNEFDFEERLKEQVDQVKSAFGNRKQMLYKGYSEYTSEEPIPKWSGKIEEGYINTDKEGILMVCTFYDDCGFATDKESYMAEHLLIHYEDDCGYSMWLHKIVDGVVFDIGFAPGENHIAKDVACDIVNSINFD